MSSTRRLEGWSPGRLNGPTLKSRRVTRRTLRYVLSVLLAFVASFMFTRRRSEAEQARKPAASRLTKKSALPASESIQTLRNLGKAYYEQGKYEEAIGEFKKIIVSGQAVATDHLDLAQALMQANRLDDALGELTTAKQMDPKLLAIDYNLGILYKRELRYPDAEAELKRVLGADPSDPAAWFNLGTVYFAEKKLEEALDAHQHVVEMGFGRAKNFYVASTFHCFTILTRLKRQAEAQKFLKTNQEMRDRVPGISLQYPALEAGEYGGVLVPAAPPVMVAEKPAAEKVTFGEITSKLGINLPPKNSVTPESEAFKEIKSSDYSLDFARHKLVPAFNGSVAVGDYDSDGHPDLFVAVPGGGNHLLHNNGNGTFTDVTEKAGVAGHGASLAATFADYNNSGRPSLFVAGLGGVTLYHNNGDGTFTDDTEKAGIKGKAGELDTRALLFDADNDGFLDLVVTAYTDLSAPPRKDSFRFPDDFAGVESHLYRNNGDGTFTDITASSGLSSAKGRMRGAVFADFNNDGYLDLLFLRDDGPPLLYINQGENRFVNRTAESGAALSQSAAVEAQVADFDHDGNFDLALWSRTGYQVLLNDGRGKFGRVERLPAITPPFTSFACRGTIADVDGDGFDDLLVMDAGGRWHLVANRAGRFEEANLDLSPGYGPSIERDKRFPDAVSRLLPSLTPAWLTHPGKLNLLGVIPNGQLIVFEKEGPPSRWLEVKLAGFKSNAQGIGAVVEFKTGNFYKKVLATGDRVRVFTGDLRKLDVVRTTWPNLIVQNSIDVATNQPLEVRESERLASSCPFLYVWNGRRYVFFTDIMGVAPLGELSPDGSRVRPNPEELVRLVSNLRDQDGNYVFQITDEMREVDYFDQLRLFAVDHPASEEIYANEIYASSPIRLSLYAVRQKHYAASAMDDRGADVLPLIREIDGRYPANFRQNRILGLAEPHTLTLDLGDFPPSSRVALWLTGWVFWTDSNASRALMSNSNLRVIPPYIQVRDKRGQWVTVIPDMGLPSGTNRTMRVDLTGKFFSSDHHVRIVTNLCVYWDQIFFTTDETAIPTPVGAHGMRPQADAVRPYNRRAVREPSLPSKGENSLREGGSAAVLCGKPTAFRQAAEQDSIFLEPAGTERLSLSAQQAAKPLSKAVFTQTLRRRVIELPLVSADLHYRGFSTPTTDPQHRRPDSFDYVKVLAMAPWNPMVGNYTRYGAVEKLLAQTDDHLVVMATGDELMVKFDGRGLPPLKSGWKRDFFLYASGYAKDGEPNTAFFRTVEPLPFRKMSNYSVEDWPYEPQQRYRDSTEYPQHVREYQTRPGYLLIPPLAPPVR